MKKSIWQKLLTEVNGKNSSCVVDRFYAQIDEDLHSKGGIQNKHAN